MSKNNLQIIILNKKNITDFAQERNKLLRSAKSEWVMFVDSDEDISDALRQEINQLINNPVNTISSYYVKRENYFLGEYIGTDKIIRLIKKGSGQWERPVHEVFHPRGGRVGILTNPLIHNTAKTLNEYIAKVNFYSSLHAETNRKEGKHSNLFKIIFYPKLKFLQSIIMGRGIVFSILQAFHSFLAWSEQWLYEN